MKKIESIQSYLDLRNSIIAEQLVGILRGGGHCQHNIFSQIFFILFLKLLSFNIPFANTTCCDFRSSSIFYFFFPNVVYLEHKNTHPRLKLFHYT